MLRRNQGFWNTGKRVPDGGGFTCSGYYNPPITGILDIYPGANLAFSVRRLTNSYIGPCLRAGHIGDPTTQQDICFINNELNIDQLIEFSESSITGQGTFISRGYRQDGSGKFIDFSVTANPPLLTDSSNNPYIVNGLPSLNFNSTGIGTVDEFPDAPIGTSIFIVYQLKSIAAPVHYLTYESNATFPGGLFVGGNSVSITGRGIAVVTVVKGQGGGEPLTSQLLSYIGAGEKKIYANGVEIVSTADKTYTDPSIEDIGRPGGFSSNSYIQEIISYPVSKSSDRSSIEGNINSYYSIY